MTIRWGWGWKFKQPMVQARQGGWYSFLLVDFTFSLHTHALPAVLTHRTVAGTTSTGSCANNGPSSSGRNGNPNGPHDSHGGRLPVH